MPGYDETYRRAREHPEAFWAEAAEAVHWFKKWDRTFDPTLGAYGRWFAGGRVNTCYNALDLKVERGLGEQTALIYDSPVTSTIETFTYRDLRDATARFAGVLQKCGVEKGDRVLIYMPMIPETVIAMLAVARLGAIHSVVFGGFAPPELATRIDHALPKVVVTASCGIEVSRVVPYKPLLEEALHLAMHEPVRVVVVERPMCQAAMTPGRDLDWSEAMSRAAPVPCVPVEATDPLYILYTSGTTGLPKGVVRDNAGHMVALAWSMKHVYGVEPGEVFWAASDLGWAVGHSYIVYGPLLYGCPAVLYEGKPVGTPDAGAFWRVITEHDVAVFFTAPTACRAIKREDPGGEHVKKYARSKLRTLFLAGERCDPDTLAWAGAQLGVPVIDHWWQTESGWPMAANCIGLGALPVKPGSPAKAVPGYRVEVLDERGAVVPAGQMGSIAVRLPLPPGCLPTLWSNDDGFRRAYLEEFPGYYKTGDAGFVDEDGYLFVMSRIDDVINVAGHRLSTGAMEEVLAGHPDVAECAVFGVLDEIKGELPIGLLVLKSGVTRDGAEIVSEVVKRVRDHIGPVAAFKTAIVVERLPKTRSGKILRGTLKKMADGTEYRVPATIDDPVVLEEIQSALRAAGFPRA